MQEFLTPNEVAEALRRSVETLRYWRAHGHGPTWIKLNGRVLYNRADLERWIKRESTVTP